MAERADADVCVVPAAVSDFTPAKKQSGKIPSREGLLSLDLQPTPKVLNRFRKGEEGARGSHSASRRERERAHNARARALHKEGGLHRRGERDLARERGDD